MAIPANLSQGQKSEKVRSILVRGSLGVGMLVSILSTFAYISQSSMLERAKNGVELTKAEIARNDGTIQMIAGVEVLLLIATGTLWLMWQYRAYTNLKLAGTGETNMTPASSVGWWFCPFINLVRPIQITTELFRRSENSNIHGIYSRATPPLFGFWWAFYILRNFMGRILGTSAIGETPSIEQLQNATTMGIVANMFDIVAGILALLVVTKITNIQQAMTSVEYTAPPSSPTPTVGGFDLGS